jgi:flagellin-like protein
VNIHQERAASQVEATLILVAITVILALLLFLALPIHFPELNVPEEPPAIFAITMISSSPPDFESRIYLRNEGNEAFPNAPLCAEIYLDGKRLPCVIRTLHTHDFISTHHYGVQTLKGSGGQDATWAPREMLRIDLSDGTIHPGDTVQVEILMTEDGPVISRDATTA